MRELITRDELLAALSYDSDTGKFSWNESKSHIPKGTSPGWHAISNGKKYLCICLNGRSYRAHRLAWLYIYGEWPKNTIDHINGDSLDNRMCNLRDVAHKENMKNCKLSKNNTSGINGVSFNEKNKLWFAYGKINFVKKHLYCGKDFFEACCARKSFDVNNGFYIDHGRKRGRP